MEEHEWELEAGGVTAWLDEARQARLSAQLDEEYAVAELDAQIEEARAYAEAELAAYPEPADPWQSDAAIQAEVAAVQRVAEAAIAASLDGGRVDYPAVIQAMDDLVGSWHDLPASRWRERAGRALTEQLEREARWAPLTEGF